MKSVILLKSTALEAKTDCYDITFYQLRQLAQKTLYSAAYQKTIANVKKLTDVKKIRQIVFWSYKMSFFILFPDGTSYLILKL